jgi:uncharacterized membrane protein (DUF4010 family)
MLAMNEPHFAETLTLLQSLGTALGLGLLVGLEREWQKNPMAGIRTFGLVGLFGGLAGAMAMAFGGWVIVGGLVACTAMAIMANLTAMRQEGEPDIGLTTEFAMLAIFAVGALAGTGQLAPAVACAGTVMVLLHSKEPLHGIIRKVDAKELKEIARLVLIGLVILPLLPNEEMGYLGVLNPFKVWLMVVLIVGISLAAYLVGKFMGGAKSAAIAGVLGGLVSSTAVTASVSRRSRGEGSAGTVLAAIVLTASCVVFARVMVEVVLTAPAHKGALLPPLALMMVWTGVIAAATLWLAKRSGEKPGEEEAPSELKGAVMFGLMYVGVLYAVALGKEHFGDAGLYAVAAISGLTDVDAITLSTSGLVAAGEVDPRTGWRVILVGGMANTVFKAGMAAVLGKGRFLRWTAAGFAAAVAGGGVILLLWPW